MWVFINGILAVDLGGVHSTPRATTLNLDQFAAAHGLVANQSVPACNLYAHRSAHGGLLGMQLPVTASCDPGGTPTSIAMSTMTLVPSAQLDGAAVQLVSPDFTSSAGAFTSLLPVAGGFKSTFSFQMTPGAEGVAFVVQTASQSSSGTGADLGYAIPNSIAVEFDRIPIRLPETRCISTSPFIRSGRV